MFIVPKFHFDHETGELTGERNGAYVTNVEHKMGIKVSNTCEVTFGDPGVGGGEAAKGWLLGEVHDGIAQMFQVIENARMMVGTKAIATLSTGYLNALDYAKSRVQGADLTQSGDKTAPRVTITHHPDVRRSLMVQKSFAEAMRALVLYTASWQDKVQIAEHEGTRTPPTTSSRSPSTTCCSRSSRATARSARGCCWAPSRCRPSAAPASCRSTRSSSTSGTPRSTPSTRARPRSRARTSSSARSSRTRARRSATWPRRSSRFIASEAGNGRLKVERGLLATALEDANAIVGHMINDLMSADPSSENGEIRNIYKVGLNTTRLLMVLGDVVCAWLLLRQAEVALEKLGGDAGRPRTRRSTRARSRRRSSSRSTTCPRSAPSARSPRPPTCR